MHSLPAMYRTVMKDRAVYFRDAKEDITADNIRMLFFASMLTMALLLLFILLAPVVIHGWAPTVYHLAFIPASALLCLSTGLQLRFKTSNHLAVNLQCILYQSTVFFFTILIDTAGTANGPAAFVPLLFIALPALFILPHRLSYGVVVLFEVLYVAAILTFKDPSLGQYDIFISLVGLSVSLTMNNLIMSLRVKDHQMQMKYKYLSTMDSLSEILNKQACLQACSDYLAAFDPHAVCSLLVIDLDDFKTVNDTKGHYTGDVVLQIIGSILRQVFRRSDVIGRFGGDEFLVLLKGTASRPLLERKCQLIQSTLRSRTLQQVQTQVSCSIGVALLQSQSTTFDQLFRQADLALYTAKKSGKGQTVILRHKSSAAEESATA